MAPKKKEEPLVTDRPFPGVPYPFPEWKDERLLALDLEGMAPPQDDLSAALPSPLAEVAAEWKRPAEFAGTTDGSAPLCVSALKVPSLPTITANASAGKGKPIAMNAAMATSTKSLPPPEALSRELPHPLSEVWATEDDEEREACRCVQWLTSCLQLIVMQAEHIEAGAFLWDLIYPKNPESGLPFVTKGGKYAVKLWDQGCWRIVAVDDRMPFTASGRPLFPSSRSPSELWPLLLAKAVYKLSAEGGGHLTQDLSVLLRLTGWFPHTYPISDALPSGAAWETLQANLAPSDCALALLLPTSSEADDALAAVGLRRGPLLAVRDVREVGGERFVRLESQLVQWAGAYRDTDEENWSLELAEALGWKRLQRLRLRGAGRALHDFWIRMDSLNAHFAHVLVLHRPKKLPLSTLYISSATGSGSPPAVLYVPSDEGGSEEVLLCAQVTAMSPPVEGTAALGRCVLSLAADDWKASAEHPTLLSLPIDRVACVPLTLTRGQPYAISLRSVVPEDDESPPPPEGAEPAHCVWSVTAASAGRVHIGLASDMYRDKLGLQVSTIEGTLPAVAAAAWTLGVAVSLKPSADTQLSATVRLKDAAVAACARLHLVDEETQKVTKWDLLTTGELQLAASPRGYTLLVDYKCAEELGPSSWSLEVLSSAQVALAALPAKGQTLTDKYNPNESYRLCRLVLGTTAKCSASLHVNCTKGGIPFPATLSFRAYAVPRAPDANEPRQTEVARAEGLSCATLMNLGLDVNPKLQTMVECSITRLSALELEVPSRRKKTTPTKGGAAEHDEDEITWSVTVSSTAPMPVTIAQDATESQALQALVASWEQGNAGRAAKAKLARQNYLSAVSAGKAGEDSPDATVYIKSAEVRVLEAEERNVMRQQLEREIASLKSARESALEQRKAQKQQNSSAASCKVKSTMAARSQTKEAHAAVLAETANLMATYAPVPEPVVDDPKARKGKK